MLPQGSDFRNVFPDRHVILSSHAAKVAHGELASPVLFSLYVKNIPQPRTTTSGPLTQVIRQT